ncbi:hypothetical protein NHX12_018658 [Muraenolepis orangiensis]|uniref:Reverse transcriptase domain-containing protein n=1 Tax=Muraenolepis orangiensis TaxID=630683 RepID=A0A9Q0EX84_9TELE|nr:hypothetical protein NHX12_018658 [Muraenolepis orangiensis]
MVKFIMEMLSNRSFILRTSDGQRSRLRRLRNGVPQGSVLSPLLFNIYIHDLPETTSRQYGYADDLAIMLRRTTWSAVEQGLNQDMGILAAYLRKWRLQLSTGKTVSAAYHLCNREAKRELSVSVDNKRLEHQLAPKYLGVRLDRTLSYKQHLEEVRAKVTARVSLIRRLAGTTWGASARTLRISTQALVFSAAEYCAPVWSRSPHVKKVDPIINNALRIITGCLKPTPVSYLPYKVLLLASPCSLDQLCSVLCSMVTDGLISERLKKTPDRFSRTDVQLTVVPVLTAVTSYHNYLEQPRQCLETGLIYRCAQQCVVSLTMCTVEIPDIMIKLLPALIVKLTHISATVAMASPILEFLYTLQQPSHLGKGCPLFTHHLSKVRQKSDLVIVGGPSSARFNQYIVSLAHVIAMWFIRCRLTFLLPFVGGLKPSSFRACSTSLNEHPKRQQWTAWCSSVRQQWTYLVLLCVRQQWTYLVLLYSSEPTWCSSVRQQWTYLSAGGQSGQGGGGGSISISISEHAARRLENSIMAAMLCDPGPPRASALWCLPPRERSPAPVTPPPLKDNPSLAEFVPMLTQGWAEVFIRRPSGNTSWLMCLENPPSPFSSELGNMPLQELSTILMAMEGTAVAPAASEPPVQTHATGVGKGHLIQRSNTAAWLQFGDSLWAVGLSSGPGGPPPPGRLHRSISWAAPPEHHCSRARCGEFSQKNLFVFMFSNSVVVEEERSVLHPIRTPSDEFEATSEPIFMAKTPPPLSRTLPKAFSKAAIESTMGHPARPRAPSDGKPQQCQVPYVEREKVIDRAVKVSNEVAILSNEYGSNRYACFLTGLGRLIHLKDCDPDQIFLGGLDQYGDDGEFTYCWHDDIMQAIFHIATLMPNKESDKGCCNKKRHIANDFVIVGHFVEVIYDYEYNLVSLQCGKDLEGLVDTTVAKIVSDQNLPLLVQQMALHENMASLVHQYRANPSDAYASKWLARRTSSRGPRLVSP